VANPPRIHIQLLLLYGKCQNGVSRVGVMAKVRTSLVLG